MCIELYTSGIACLNVYLLYVFPAGNGKIFFQDSQLQLLFISKQIFKQLVSIFFKSVPCMARDSIT